VSPPFADRAAAGAALAAALRDRVGDGRVVVLALPRGGVPVAAPVAEALGAELDVFPVRKLGVPGQPELAMGAIAPGGVRVLNASVLEATGVDDDAVERVARDEGEELRRRELAYRGDRPPADLRGATVVLVDDGLATGATVRAAVQAVRAWEPARVVVAVPVGAPGSCAAVANVADDVVCLHSPERFTAVGVHYDDFRQTTDEQVRALLAAHR
jgi:predicted phosphoribosyltransferase